MDDRDDWMIEMSDCIIETSDWMIETTQSRDDYDMTEMTKT